MFKVRVFIKMMVTRCRIAFEVEKMRDGPCHGMAEQRGFAGFPGKANVEHAKKMAGKISVRVE